MSRTFTQKPFSGHTMRIHHLGLCWSKYIFPTSNEENTLYQHIMRNYTIPAFLWQQLIN